MKHSFRVVDFEALTAFWNNFYPSRYRIDADLLRLKTIQCPVFDWGASVVEIADGEILGFAIVKRSGAFLYKGPDIDTAHLAAIAYREPEYGVDLVSYVKNLLRNRGIQRLVFGADANHFFPGCPNDFPNLQNFLMVEGFEGSNDFVDLERNLSDYVNPSPPTPGDEYRRLTSSDRNSLDQFFENEFPGRWRHDVHHQISTQGIGTVFGVLREGVVEGFALLQDSNQFQPIGGAVWRNDLGDQWGSLGPIGISKRIRGQGSGHALLGMALTDLKDSGVRQCIIDWTTLIDFYGRHGFLPARQYRGLSLKLSD